MQFLDIDSAIINVIEYIASDQIVTPMNTINEISESEGLRDNTSFA